MRIGRNEPCPCGSGLKFKRCCGASRAHQARLATLQNAGALLPSLRPRGVAVLAFAARVADELGENEGYVPDGIVAEGVELVDAEDRAALLSTFRDALPDADHLLAELGEWAERELVGSAIRGAICDRRPVPRTQLLVLEVEQQLPPEVGVRLGAVLPSGAVWSIRDAERVIPDLPDGFLWQRVWEPRDGSLFDCVEDWHVERVRLLCDALRRHLPLPSLPRASEIAAADCEVVLADDEQARRVAATLLLSHASWLAASGSGAASLN